MLQGGTQAGKRLCPAGVSGVSGRGGWQGAVLDGACAQRRRLSRPPRQPRSHPNPRCSQVGKKITSLRDAFKRADKQGGGTIDRDELQQMCIALTLPKETQAALLNQIDMDGDGEWCYAEVSTSTLSFPLRDPAVPSRGQL